MNEDELAIAKRITEIEGLIVTVKICKGDDEYWMQARKPGYYNGDYNPFNWSILGPLMVKHDIEISYFYNYVYINDGNDDDLYWEYFKNKSDIPRAILECIITSKEPQ